METVSDRNRDGQRGRQRKAWRETETDIHSHVSKLSEYLNVRIMASASMWEGWYLKAVIGVE